MIKLIKFLVMIIIAITTITAQNTDWYTENPDANTFYISNEADLQGLSELVNRSPNSVNFNGKTIILNNDIQLMLPHTPIGRVYSFRGVFDGNGNKISNLSVLSGNNNGLFGYVGANGQIKNLTVNVSEIKSLGNSSYAGGLAACYASTKAIENCVVNIADSIYAEATTSIYVAVDSYCGGLVGYVSAATTIINSYTTGKVSSYSPPTGYSIMDKKYPASNSHSGGLVGRVENGIGITIVNSHTSGDVFSESKPAETGSSYSGGLIGFVNSTTDISNSYTTGNISAHSPTGAASYGGGLVGNAGSITIKYSYTSGDISATSVKGTYAGSCYSGGLVGNGGGTATIENSYSSGNIYANGDDGADAGGLMGKNGTTTIKNSYTTGNVFAHGTSYFALSGGLVGSTINQTYLTNCYASGTMTATGWNANYGALFGKWSSGTNVSTYYNSENTKNSSGITSPSNVNGKTSAQLKQEATFVNWDFDEIWGIDDGINSGYPYLLSFYYAPCEHEYGELEERLAATCETDGYKSKNCSICNKETAKETIGKLGHKFETDEIKWIEKILATCFAKGSAKALCARDDCDAHEIKELPIDKNAHSFGELEEIETATCTENGYKAKICSLCGGETDVEIIYTLEHIPNISAATCTYSKVCVRYGCGEILEKWTGHKINIPFETCLVDQKCETCDEIFGEKTGHGYDGDAPTCIYPKYCTKLGCTEPTLEPSLGHKYTGVGALKTSATCESPAIHWGKCVNTCGLDSDFETVFDGEELGHDFETDENEWFVDLFANCMTKGSAKAFCKRDGCDEYEIKELDIIECGKHTCDDCGITCDLHTCDICERICELHTCEICERTCDLHICEICGKDCADKHCGICGITCDEHVCVTCGRTCNLHTCELCERTCDLHVCDICEKVCTLHICEICGKTCDCDICKPVSIIDMQKSNKPLFKSNIVNDKMEIILDGNVSFVVYDMTGNVVASGNGKTWDLKNRSGRFIANGTYLVIAEAKDGNERVYVYSAKLGVKR